MRDQEKLAGDIRPLVVNVMNFSKAATGEPTLLSLRRRPHAVPRVRPRAARPALRRHLSDDLRHQRADRLGRTAVAALRALAGAAGGPAAVRRATTRPASRCRRRCCAKLHGGAHLQPGLSRRSNTSPRRWSISTCICSRAGRRISTSTPSSRPRWRASACRTRSSCATARRISRTCSPAAATPRPITATCGRRCSTPTPSRRSRRPATSSIRRPRRSCTTRLFGRRLARPGRALHRLPRPPADARRAAAEARA